MSEQREQRIAGARDPEWTLEEREERARTAIDEAEDALEKAAELCREAGWESARDLIRDALRLLRPGDL